MVFILPTSSRATSKNCTIRKDSKSDKEQVDKLFESFDASSDESISKLKELSETSLKTDTGKDYLNNKVKESSKAIVDFHLQKGLAYDIKDSDDKFKDKTTLENNVKEINKQIDFIKKVDETFKQDNLEETTKSLTDIVDKFNKQIEALKKEEGTKSKLKRLKKRRNNQKLNHKNLLVDQVVQAVQVLTHLLILDQIVAEVIMKPQLPNNIHLATAIAAEKMMAIQDIGALMLVVITATLTEITVMVTSEMTMETILETLVAALQNLDNVNNYFRAVLFRMVTIYIKSYSFF